MQRRIGVLAALLIVLSPAVCHGQARVEANVVYGMYSGLALLMDVHYPASPNGIGIIFIQGSGWHAPLSLDAAPLKESVGTTHIRANALLQGGYTLFVINHRAAPRFRYPAAVEDAQRAVRFVRHYAARFRIDADRIGATGFSSGGHLAAMLGVLNGAGIPEDRSPINQESSKVQAVVAFAPATDFVAFATDPDGDKVIHSSFLGSPLRRDAEPSSEEALLYAEASPITYVTSDDPPVLLIHGDADPVVPVSQSALFQEALAEAGVTVEFMRAPGVGHSTRTLDQHYIDAMVEWFDRYLRDIQ